MNYKFILNFDTNFYSNMSIKQVTFSSRGGLKKKEETFNQPSYCQLTTKQNKIKPLDLTTKRLSPQLSSTNVMFQDSTKSTLSIEFHVHRMKQMLAELKSFQPHHCIHIPVTNLYNH